MEAYSMLLLCEARGGRACVVLPSDYRSINKYKYQEEAEERDERWEAMEAL
jgi:hypothetical protein